MTDELSIQQKRPSATPYLLGGAAVGGAAGYAVDKWVVSKPMSHEDIIAEVNAKDKFEARISEGKEVDAWKDVQSKTESLKQAESKLEAASKPTLAEDHEIAKKLKTAEQEWEEAIANKTRTRTTTSGSGKAEILPHNDNWKMSEAQRTEYKDLYSKWETAKNTFENSTEFKNLNTEITNRKNLYQSLYDETATDAAETIKRLKDKKRGAVRNFTEYYNSGSGADAIEKLIKSKNLDHLNNTEVIKLAGGEKGLVNSRPMIHRGKDVIEVTRADGKKAYAVIDSKTLKNAKQQKLDKVFKDVTENLEKYTEANNKLNNLHKEVKFDKGLLKQAGIRRNSAGAFVDAAGKPINIQHILTEYESKLAEFTADMKVLKDAGVHEFAPKPGVTATYSKEVEAVINKYGANSPKELFETLGAKKSIANKFANEKVALQETIESIMIKDTGLAELEGKMKDLKKSQTDLRNLESKIRGRFKDFLGKPKATTSSTAGLTREEAIKQLEKSDLAKKLKDLKAQYEQAAQKSGKVDTAAKEAAEKAVAEAKTALKEATSNLGKKMGKGGKAGLCIAGGAALTGLLATMFRPKA